MNGFRFFADLAGTAGIPAGANFQDLMRLSRDGKFVNCIALKIDGSNAGYGACGFGPNGDVYLDTIAPEYLRDCRRIPERVARKLHPRLFETLEKSS